MKQEITKWDITWSLIFKVLLVVILAYTLFLIRSILLIGLASLIVSIIFNPAISFLTKRKLPRTFSAILVYGVFLLILVLIVYLVFPPIISEVGNFSNNFSHYLTNFAGKISAISGINFLDLNLFLSKNPGIGENLVDVSRGVFNFLTSFIVGLSSVFTVFVLAFFLSIEENELTKMIRSFSPKKWEEAVLKSWQKSQDQVMGWFASRLITSLAVGVLTFIACFFLNIKFTVSVSVLAGLLNLVPLIGPTIAAIILFSLGLLNSFTTGVLIVVIAILIQLIENYILTPLITKKIIGIPNFLVLLSILIGSQLMGVVGALLAIPLFAVLYETLHNYFIYKKNQE